MAMQRVCGVVGQQADLADAGPKIRQHSSSVSQAEAVDGKDTPRPGGLTQEGDGRCALYKGHDHQELMTCRIWSIGAEELGEGTGKEVETRVFGLLILLW